MLDLTIAIPVKNEEKNLQGCLEAIGSGFAKEIVLLDSGSTDRTLQIAEQYQVPVMSFEWNGKFPKKRNWYLQNHTPKTTWVLFLDADEYVTSEFKTELQMALQNTDKVGFWLNYSIYFMGKQLKGGYPLKKLALFKVSAGEYEHIDEEGWSQLDMEIHEHPQLRGETGIIKSKIDHRDFRGISHYIAKHNEYASWEAARYLRAKENARQWTWKQKLKYKLMRSPLIGPVFFIGSYIVMGGFRDGARGFVFALFKLFYFTSIYAKIKELEATKK